MLFIRFLVHLHRVYKLTASSSEQIWKFLIYTLEITSVIYFISKPQCGKLLEFPGTHL